MEDEPAGAIHPIDNCRESRVRRGFENDIYTLPTCQDLPLGLSDVFSRPYLAKVPVVLIT
jgi:hypothetical protein